LSNSEKNGMTEPVDNVEAGRLTEGLGLKKLLRRVYGLLMFPPFRE